MTAYEAPRRYRGNHNSSAVSGFSDDGRWWWDGTVWVSATSVVLPRLPPTDFEKSGQLELARAELRKGQRDFWKWNLVGGLFFDLSTQNAYGAPGYRTWTLQQAELATTYLLGPDEPMLAGEVNMYALWDYYTRDYVVVVTAAHVLVLRIDSLEGQPRWVVLAARANDVKIEARGGWFGRLWPGLAVTGRTGRWTINGYVGFNPGPLINAWRQAATATANTR